MVDLPSSEDCAEILKKKMDKAGVEFSEKQWNTVIDKFTLYSGSGTVISGKPGLGNLSIKNRLRDRFSGSKSRQVAGQRFSEPNFRQESRTGF